MIKDGSTNLVQNYIETTNSSLYRFRTTRHNGDDYKLALQINKGELCKAGGLKLAITIMILNLQNLDQQMDMKFY
jgi:hypothetical protein